MKKATMIFWGWYSTGDVYKEFLCYISKYKKTDGNVEWTLSGSPDCDMTRWLQNQINWDLDSRTIASRASKKVELV